MGLTLPDGALGEEYEGIWPENLPALLAYLEVHTQWRVIGLADGRKHTVGLDYAGVRAGLKLAKVKVTKALWSDLRMIEIGARDAMNGVSG